MSVTIVSGLSQKGPTSLVENFSTRRVKCTKVVLYLFRKIKITFSTLKKNLKYFLFLLARIAKSYLTYLRLAVAKVTTICGNIRVNKTQNFFFL